MCEAFVLFIENGCLRAAIAGVGFLLGAVLPIVITLISTKPLTREDLRDVWSPVQKIDNPLVPWPEVFSR